MTNSELAQSEWRGRVGTASRWLGRIPALCVIGVVRCYQKLISPWLGPHCRFQPSCSNYMILAVRKYGLFRGILRGAWRICKCHPLHPGGYDPP